MPKIDFSKIAHIDSKIWDDMAGELQSSGTGLFFSPKNGKTKARLVPMEDTGRFFIETTRLWQGKARTKYLVAVNLLETPNGKVDGDLASKVVFLILPKKAVQAILGLLSEGYDLLSEKDGRGLVFNRTGTGTDTSYSVLPSPKSIPLPADLVYPEETLTQLSEEFAKSSAERDAKKTEPPIGEGKARKGDTDSEDW